MYVTGYTVHILALCLISAPVGNRLNTERWLGLMHLCVVTQISSKVL